MLTVGWGAHIVQRELALGMLCREGRQVRLKASVPAGMFVDQGAEPRVLFVDSEEMFSEAYRGFTHSIRGELESSSFAHRRKLTTFEARPGGGYQVFFAELLGESVRLSESHRTPLARDTWYSAGFIRFNLVKSAQAFTSWLLEHHEDLETQYGILIRLNFYGAGLDTVSRQHLEGRFGKLLNRKTEAYLEVPELERALAEGRPMLYLVITTPIIEVGRDYDFDFAVLEPCSDMSIIQPASRVLRHRRHNVPEAANVSLMSFSLRAMERQQPGVNTCLYGNRGPGVEQRDPVTDEVEVDSDAFQEGVWRLPAGKSASELFGLEVYREGIHAGYRVERPVTVADTLEREIQRSILLNEGRKNRPRPSRSSQARRRIAPRKTSCFRGYLT